MSHDRNNEIRDAAMATLAGWVAAIADNVNNPVAGISAALALVEREIEHYRATGECNQELVLDSAKRMRERLKLLSEYVGELASFARPEVIWPVHVSAPELIASARRELEPILANVDVAVTVHPGAESFQADPARLRVVVKCLLRNAVEATAKIATPRVAIELAPASREGKPVVALTVDDNGPGFSAASYVHAGEPFYSTKEAGTGFGLAIVRKVARSHNGALDLGASPKLGGARVTLTLPMTTSTRSSR